MLPVILKLMENQEILNQEIADQLLKIEGQSRGIHFKNDAEFILLKKGEPGLKQVETELAGLGIKMDYKKIKNLGFFPAGLRAISLLAAKKVFRWSDDDIRDMGRFASRVSFVIKLYLKFFYSITKTLEKVSSMWKEYWTRGKITVEEYSEKEKRVVLRVEEMDLHPVYCRCLEGYFEGVTKMVVKAEKPECRETECVFSGGKFHKFVIKY